jgi:hypothetical protein
MKGYLQTGEREKHSAYIDELINAGYEPAERRYCDNIAANTITAHYLSSKRDSAGIVAKYGGEARFEAEGNVFLSSVALGFNNAITNVVNLTERAANSRPYARLQATNNRRGDYSGCMAEQLP